MKPSQQLLTAAYVLLICYVFCVVVNGTEEYSYEGPEFTVTESQFIRSLSLYPLIPLKSHHTEVWAPNSIHTKLEIPLKQQPVSEKMSSIFLGGLHKLPASLLTIIAWLWIPVLCGCLGAHIEEGLRISPFPSHYSPSFSTLSKQECLSQSLTYVFQHCEQHFKMATLLQRATRSQAWAHSMFFSVQH